MLYISSCFFNIVYSIIGGLKYIASSFQLREDIAYPIQQILTILFFNKSQLIDLFLLTLGMNHYVNVLTDETGFLMMFKILLITFCFKFDVAKVRDIPDITMTLQGLQINEKYIPKNLTFGFQFCIFVLSNR